ncbi:DinB family protein [Paenibacillus sp. TAF58]
MLELTRNVLEDMEKQLDRIIKSISLLDDDLIWKKMKDSMNSIGNLCLHLAGNEYQNLISAIGNKPFIRERTREFNSEGGISKDELISLLSNTRSESANILSALSEKDLKREVIIRYDLEDWNRMLRVNASEDETYEVRLISRLLVQVASHYGYHAGQIVLLSKLLKDSNEHITGQYH